ncbi:MAG: cupin domain-containing protein [Proteobacteria bacterium]|nr:cupin domain-containing protein [Pseudomonadota bacterium]
MSLLEGEETAPAEKRLSMGQRIRRFREEKSFSLQQVANETGRSVEYLEQVENDKIMPPVAVLLQISRALELESGALLKNEVAQAERRAEEGRKRTRHYSYQVLTPPSGKRHLSAYMVGIEPRTEHEGPSYQHEGEEFAYVLSGQLEYTIGDNVNQLAKGQSLHFNSSLVHKLRNPGDEPAELLVILYTP